MRKLGFNTWQNIQHSDFDSILEDNFPETSLHFCFTGYEQPLNTGEHGLKDQEAYFLQAVVQVYERGIWIADLDSHVALQRESWIQRLPSECDHTQKQTEDSQSLGQITPIDCWDELLDSSEQVSVVRTHKNWLVAHQTKKPAFITNGKVCWSCFKSVYSGKEKLVII